VQTAVIILITAVIVSALNMVCFFTGAKIRQRVDNSEELEIPNLNPLDKWREQQRKKEEEQEAKKLEVILENIEIYDGTSNGQKDIPE